MKCLVRGPVCAINGSDYCFTIMTAIANIAAAFVIIGTYKSSALGIYFSFLFQVYPWV